VPPAVGRERLAYNRPVKIYTRTGDSGETGLFDGRRVRKSDARVDAYGEVDELNAALGVVLTEALDADVADMLRAIQRDLFAVGGRLADPGGKVAPRVEKVTLGSAEIGRLEEWIDRLESELPPLRRFILPGGCRAGALLHVARTICRRAERRIVLIGPDALEPELLAYVNRLSDYLFVVARAVNRRAGAAEIEW
jgi:cob(I)alamin adenosyltransferase